MLSMYYFLEYSLIIFNYYIINTIRDQTLSNLAKRKSCSHSSGSLKSTIKVLGISFLFCLFSFTCS